MLLGDEIVAVLTGYMTDEKYGERKVARLAVHVINGDGSLGKGCTISIGLPAEWMPSCHHLMWRPDEPPIAGAVAKLRGFLREHRGRRLLYLQSESMLVNDVILAGMPEAAMTNVSDDVRKILRDATGHVAVDEQLLHSLVAYCAGKSGAKPYEGLKQFPDCGDDAIAFARCVGMLRRLK